MLTRTCPWCAREFRPRRRDQVTCGGGTCRKRESRHRRADHAEQLRSLARDLQLATDEYLDRSVERLAWKYRHRVVLRPADAARVEQLASELYGRYLAAEWTLKKVSTEPSSYRPPHPNTGRRLFHHNPKERTMLERDQGGQGSLFNPEQLNLLERRAFQRMGPERYASVRRRGNVVPLPVRRPLREAA